MSLATRLGVRLLTEVIETAEALAAPIHKVELHLQHGHTNLTVRTTPDQVERLASAIRVGTTGKCVTGTVWGGQEGARWMVTVTPEIG